MNTLHVLSTAVHSVTAQEIYRSRFWDCPVASAKWESYITQTERSLPPLDVVWEPGSRSSCGFSRWAHSVGGAECAHRKKKHGGRVVGAYTTSILCSDGHRQHLRRCPSEQCGHPGTWLKVLELVNLWSKQLSGMPPQLPWPWDGSK